MGLFILAVVVAFFAGLCSRSAWVPSAAQQALPLGFGAHAPPPAVYGAIEGLVYSRKHAAARPPVAWGMTRPREVFPPEEKPVLAEPETKAWVAHMQQQQQQQQERPSSFVLHAETGMDLHKQAIRQLEGSRSPSLASEALTEALSSLAERAWVGVRAGEEVQRLRELLTDMAFKLNVLCASLVGFALAGFALAVACLAGVYSCGAHEEGPGAPAANPEPATAELEAHSRQPKLQGDADSCSGANDVAAGQMHSWQRLAEEWTRLSSALRGSLAELRSENGDLREQLAGSRREVAEARSLCSRLFGVLEKSRGVLERALQGLAHARGQVELAKGECGRLRVEGEESARKVQEMQGEWVREAATMAGKVSDAVSSCEALREALATLLCNFAKGEPAGGVGTPSQAASAPSFVKTEGCGAADATRSQPSLARAGGLRPAAAIEFEPGFSDAGGSSPEAAAQSQRSPADTPGFGTAAATHCQPTFAAGGWSGAAAANQSEPSTSNAGGSAVDAAAAQPLPGSDAHATGGLKPPCSPFSFGARSGHGPEEEEEEQPAPAPAWGFQPGFSFSRGPEEEDEEEATPRWTFDGCATRGLNSPCSPFSFGVRSGHGPEEEDKEEEEGQPTPSPAWGFQPGFGFSRGPEEEDAEEATPGCTLDGCATRGLKPPCSPFRFGVRSGSVEEDEEQPTPVPAWGFQPGFSFSCGPEQEDEEEPTPGRAFDAHAASGVKPPGSPFSFGARNGHGPTDEDDAEDEEEDEEEPTPGWTFDAYAASGLKPPCSPFSFGVRNGCGPEEEDEEEGAWDFKPGVSFGRGAEQPAGEPRAASAFEEEEFEEELEAEVEEKKEDEEEGGENGAGEEEAEEEEEEADEEAMERAFDEAEQREEQRDLAEDEAVLKESLEELLGEPSRGQGSASPTNTLPETVLLNTIGFLRAKEYSAALQAITPVTSSILAFECPKAERLTRDFQARAFHFRAEALRALGRLVEAARDYGMAQVLEPQCLKYFMRQIRVLMKLQCWRNAKQAASAGLSSCRDRPKEEVQLHVEYFQEVQKVCDSRINAEDYQFGVEAAKRQARGIDVTHLQADGFERTLDVVLMALQGPGTLGIDTLMKATSFEEQDGLLKKLMKANAIVFAGEKYVVPGKLGRLNEEDATVAAGFAEQAKFASQLIHASRVCMYDKLQDTGSPSHHPAEDVDRQHQAAQLLLQ